MVEAGGDGGDPPPLHWVVAVVLTVAARSFRVCHGPVEYCECDCEYWIQNSRILVSERSDTGFGSIGDWAELG